MSGPLVGIFWGIRVEDRPFELLVDQVPVAEAEPYGACLTHGGHFEYWQQLAAVGAVELRRRGLPTAPVWSEYDEWPRGRVVGLALSPRFVIYADAKLRHRPAIDLIAARFNLPLGSFRVRSDPHYVSVRSIGTGSPPAASS